MVKTREFIIASVVFVFALRAAKGVDSDWLVTRVTEPVKVEEVKGGKEIVMSNGLISRRFRLAPNAATVGYDNLMTEASIIRGVKPEAIVEIDGQKYEVGGLVGQVEYGYLLEEGVDSLTSNPDSFQLQSFKAGQTKERFAWR